MNKTIKKVEVSEKGVIFNQFNILKEVSYYYETVCKNLDSELYIIYLTSLPYFHYIPKAESDKSSALVKDIEEVEVLLVLKNMKNNKYLWSDIFTTEFNKLFWNDLKIFIMKAIRQIFLQYPRDSLLFRVCKRETSLDNF